MNPDTQRGIWRAVLRMPFDELQEYLRLTRKADAVMAKQKAEKGKRKRKSKPPTPNP